jgi:hypothetical protein
MGFYDEDEFEDTKIIKQERQLLGYCFYDKSEIYEDDDIVRYQGNLYHRANFLQSQLGADGEIIGPDEE